MSISGKRPKINVDIGPLLDDQWTGIPVFTRRLIRALQSNDVLDLIFTSDFVRLPASQVEASIATGTGAFLRESLHSRSRVDVEFVDFNVPIFFPSNKPLNAHLAREASTVHDMSALVMPENHNEANVANHLDHFEEEVDTNEVIFCISEATQAALVTALPSVTSKTRLLYQYVDWPASFRWLERNMPKISFGRYAVVIGTVEPRKNLGLLLQALTLPSLMQSDLTFIVVGKKGWLVDSFLEGLTPAQRKRIIFSGYVTEFVKYRLIANAEFLVFPSLYEGFGIPALEALSLGKPVLASFTSSFPEVIGNAGVFFDPFSAEGFAAALQEISHPARLAELAPLAIAQNAKFTPSRMAAPVVTWALS